jgi:hypothetical protein
VGLEDDATFFNFAQTGETEDLEAAGIGKDGIGPGHETVEAAQLADELMPRPEEKMIGVGEQNLDPEVVREITLGQPLDSRLRADGHEDGRFDSSVRRVEKPGASAGVRAFGDNFKGDGAQRTIVAGRARLPNLHGFCSQYFIRVYPCSSVYGFAFRLV